MTPPPRNDPRVAGAVRRDPPDLPANHDSSEQALSEIPGREETANEAERREHRDRRRSVLSVCYRHSADTIEFLLVRSSARRWTIPRGRVRTGESSGAAAAREALEEAGASGCTSQNPFTTVRLHGRGAAQSADAFLVQVDCRHRPLRRYREPTWFTVDEAVRVLSANRGGDEAAALRQLVIDACQAIVDKNVPE